MSPNQIERPAKPMGRPRPASGMSTSVDTRETAFGYPRDFLANRFVYIVISPRAGGLSIGVNMNPDKACNFDCLYCEVDRKKPGAEARLDIKTMASELRTTLQTVRSGGLRELPRYQVLPAHMLQLQHVALSGDGEPTLTPDFPEVVQRVVHVRAISGLPFFKVVLITNATGLDRSPVQQGLRLLTREDEVWAKLDGGTEGYLARINRPQVPLSKVLANILLIGRQRPVVIQSLFPAIEGAEPPEGEIGEYAQRLKELKAGGAQISLVQIYSATRPMSQALCGHLPLRALSKIAQTVRDVAGLRVEVF